MTEGELEFEDVTVSAGPLSITIGSIEVEAESSRPGKWEDGASSAED
jgi:hypothetical protein